MSERDLHYTLRLTGVQLSTLKDLAHAGATYDSVPLGWPIRETLDAIDECIKRGPDEYSDRRREDFPA